MNKKNLPNYTFDWAGVLTLILGMLIPQVILTIISLIISLIFNIIIVEKPWFILISTLLMWFSVISAYNLLICKPKTGEYLRFNTSIPTLKTISITIPMVLGMMFINEFTSSLLPTTGTFWGNQYLHFIEMIEKLSENKPVTILLVGIIAPIFEEIVFRGIIQKGLINKGMNVQKAIWISAIVFGIVHANPWQLVGGILIGYVLGFVYHKAKTILLPILLHAFNNGISVLMIYNIGIKGNFSDLFKISDFTILIIGIILFIFFYIIFNKYNNTQTNNN